MSVDPGALNDPPEPHVDRAALLGAEHGYRDAEAWLTVVGRDALQRSVVGHLGGFRPPEPDLSVGALAEAVGANRGDVAFWGRELTDPLCDAYNVAYRAAVEETVRERA